MSSILMPRPFPATRPRFTRSQLAHLRGELERELHQLEAQVARDEPGHAEDGRATGMPGGEQLRHRLTRIREAIERLERGAYGICANCRQAIPYPRLEVIPDATTCAACRR